MSMPTCLAIPGAAGDASHDQGGAVPVRPPPATGQEQRSLAASPVARPIALLPADEPIMSGHLLCQGTLGTAR
jgi:hypothetical protein